MTKKNKWFCVATAGATVDGREITADWITQMAESYSLDEYTALIWAEHARGPNTPSEGRNWGTVDALKCEFVDGAAKLFAQITPNQYLLDANKNGQKLFTSIEPNPDFRKTGKCYLMGLAVTDSPASAGTTRLKFSRGADLIEREYSGFEVLNFSSDAERIADLEARFSALESEYKKLCDSFKSLDDTFSLILSEAPGQRPAGTGSSSSHVCW